jgi:hypothetical protein
MTEEQREKNRLRKSEWRRKKKEADPEYINKQKKSRANQWLKQKQNPDYIAKMRKNQAHWYQNKKQDPDFIAKKQDPNFIAKNKEYQKLWRQNKKELSPKKEKKTKIELADRQRQYSAKYYQKKKEQMIISGLIIKRKRVVKTDIERREYQRKWYRNKKETDPTFEQRQRQRAKATNKKRSQNVLYILHMRTGSAIRRSLYRVNTRKQNKISNILPYTFDVLHQHLESLFTDGMTWENYGRGGWHIDHKKPISSFSFTSETDPEFLQCWSLSNLQPLWETTRVINGVEYLGNLNKSAKII